MLLKITCKHEAKGREIVYNSCKVDYLRTFNDNNDNFNGNMTSTGVKYTSNNVQKNDAQKYKSS